jgi:hypothetical protein
MDRTRRDKRRKWPQADHSLEAALAVHSTIACQRIAASRESLAWADQQLEKIHTQRFAFVAVIRRTCFDVVDANFHLGQQAAEPSTTATFVRSRRSWWKRLVFAGRRGIPPQSSECHVDPDASALADLNADPGAAIRLPDRRCIPRR